MAIIKMGNTICENCGKSFEWNRNGPIRQHIDNELYQVETISADKTIAYRFTKNTDNNYDVSAMCPHCNYDNWFTYKGNVEGNE